MRETRTHVYFFSDKDVFSNFYNHPFEYKGKSFFCSEQAFMWEKARHFRDNDIEGRILRSRHPYECKKLGRAVKGFDNQEWLSVREQYWLGILTAKYSVEPLKERLLATGDKVLVEASPYDKVYGVGLAETDNRILDDRNWRGDNLLGRLLMVVREELK